MLTNSIYDFENNKKYFNFQKQKTLENQKLTEEQLTRNEQLRIKEQQNQIDFNIQQAKILDIFA